MFLAITGFMVIWFCSTTGSAQPKVVPAPDGGKARSAVGVGETLESAKLNVANDAIAQISDLMRKHVPPLETLTLTEDYVNKYVLTKTENGKAGEQKLNLLGKDVIFKTWTVPFRPDDEWWSDIVRRDQDKQREIRSKHRQTLTGRIMVGLSVLLLVGFGYLRLDDYTRQRYTTWLRLAGVGVATTALAGWWWVFVSG